MQQQVVMKDAWEDLHEQPRFQPLYPHEIVVRWTFQNFKNNPGARILDVGCGTGRHAFFLAREGFEAYACDISSSGVATTDKRAKEMGLKVHTQTNPIHKIDYEDGFFDGIMSYGVLNYAHYDEICEAARKMYAQLKPGGKLLIVTRGEKDWRLDYADPAGPYMYKMNRLTQGSPSDVEQGMLQCYLDSDKLREVFKDFSSLSLDIQMLSWQDGKYCDQDYIIQAVK